MGAHVQRRGQAESSYQVGIIHGERPAVLLSSPPVRLLALEDELDEDEEVDEERFRFRRRLSRRRSCFRFFSFFFFLSFFSCSFAAGD